MMGRVLLILMSVAGVGLLIFGGWGWFHAQRGGPVSVAGAPSVSAPVVWVTPRHADPPTPPAFATGGVVGAPGDGLGIIGGAPAPFAADAPGQVTLRLRSIEGDQSITRSCEGTLIDAHWVLTAHHCVDDPYIRADVYGQGWSGFAFKAWGHSGHTIAGSPGDLALVRLTAPAPPLAELARLATDHEVAALSAGGRMQARGRGATTTGASGPDNTLNSYEALRAASVTLTSRGPYLLGVMHANGGPCVGDSGGALVDPTRPGVVYGILSGVSPRADGQLCTADTPAWYLSSVGVQQWVDGVFMAHRQDQLPGQ